MPANVVRGTPGLILLAFACAQFLATAGAWQIRRGAPEAAEVIPLSGLGDRRFYTRLSENDFFNPALIFPEAPHGLYRRTVNPVARDDAKMRRIGPERTGRFLVYTDAPSKARHPAGDHPRWYLKAAEGRYVEFGEAKYHPAFDGGPR